MGPSWLLGEAFLPVPLTLASTPCKSSAQLVAAIAAKPMTPRPLIRRIVLCSGLAVRSVESFAGPGRGLVERNLAKTAESVQPVLRPFRMLSSANDRPHQMAPVLKAVSSSAPGWPIVLTTHGLVLPLSMVNGGGASYGSAGLIVTAIVPIGRKHPTRPMQPCKSCWRRQRNRPRYR